MSLAVFVELMHKKVILPLALFRSNILSHYIKFWISLLYFWVDYIQIYF